MNDNNLSVQFMAARALVEAGAIDKARPLMTAMASEILAEPQAYAKIVEGAIALKTGDPRQAIEVLTQANALLDTWLGHFELGRAYLAAEQFAQADSEFERCLKRRGEALQLILGDEPTYAYVPPVYYYQGQVREGMKVEGAYVSSLMLRPSSLALCGPGTLDHRTATYEHSGPRTRATSIRKARSRVTDR
jgi:tetratricopeptide (TPR) repeat protein